MSIMKNILLISACLCALSASAEVPTWLETDSAEAIKTRTRADFPYTLDEFFLKTTTENPNMTYGEFDRQVAKKYIETLEIDGEVRVHRKAPRNMQLLNRAISKWKHRGHDASAKDISYVDSILDPAKADGAAHRVVYKFSIDVPNHEAILGDTLRVWMPLPMETQRQSNILILSVSHPDYELSAGRSIHNSIYFEVPVGKKGETTHIEYTGTFDTRGEFFPAEEILANIKPYDKNSEVYKKYTAFEAPHIIPLEKLAKRIARNETNPFLLSEKVYDYIVKKYPWAGAREYSTIPCIPEYVIEQEHGDCGQVALLYISLMRTLGIPARWESGWMIHPGEVGLHDWAEVYFEGVGWVPVDVSFGRFTTSENPDVVGFYSHGMDAYRFATNQGVCGEFCPPKRFVRSETVDAQMGEVETSRGNLFYPGWDSNLEIISVTPIK